MGLGLKLRWRLQRACRVGKRHAEELARFVRAKLSAGYHHHHHFRRRLKEPISHVMRAISRTKRYAIDATRVRGPDILKGVRRNLAHIDRRLIGLRYKLQNRINRHGGIALSVTIVLALTCSYLLAPLVQNSAGEYFNPERFTALRSLLGTIGGALVGATAIGFSVVTIAVQLNFARMPHGLFLRLSSDARLLGAFFGTFLLAIVVAALSIIPDAGWVALALITATWGTLLILVLFLYGYRRALSLINPAVQLRLLVSDAQKDLQRWARRADRMSPLLNIPPQERDHDGNGHPSHDLARVVFYRANPLWTNKAKRDVAHAISFARRYAEQGDFEVSAAALNSVVSINTTYVAAKGKTFFASNPIFDIPDASDPFINDTLEHLRRLAHSATARGDEEATRQIFAAMSVLVQVYMRIDYGTSDAKEHARLAAGYLTGAVEEAGHRGPPDLLMEGVRFAGRSASLFLASGHPNDITSLVEKIATLSLAGVLKPDYRPVTLVGMEQLAQLTFDLLRVQRRDIDFAVNQLRNSVELVAKILLNVPDTPLTSVHSSYLAPYYSLTKTQTLADKLTLLSNALIDAKKDDPAAKAILHNFETWSDELHRTEKGLFLLAVEKRSHFAFDSLHWIQHITKLLVGLSKAPATDDHTRDELEKNAIWLMSVISWIPEDKEAISFVQNFSVTELMFETAIDAANRDSFPVLECCRDLLVDWAFKAGKFETGWNTLERAVLALTTLALWREEWPLVDLLKAEILKRIRSTSIKQELLDRTARDLRQQAAFPRRREFELDRIHHAMNQLEYPKVQALLTEIANIISPETANEGVPPRRH